MAIVLKSERLLLKVEEPGEYYTGSRFDHTGNITQITLDGRNTFCSTEIKDGFNPQKNGCGLYNEFGINRTVGYDDCPVGEKFLKIGVGLLTRADDKPYNFFVPYEVKPFKTLFESDTQQIRFTVMPENCRGYSVKLIKSITLSANSFAIEYTLENTGTRRIQTNEYVHNFISVNQSPVTTGYALSVPCRIIEESGMYESVNPEKAVSLNDRTLSFNFVPSGDFFFSPLTEFRTNTGEWMLTDERSGVLIRETTDFIPELMNIWGTGHVISPELFIKIDIMPGETLQWQRTYELDYF